MNIFKLASIGILLICIFTFSSCTHDKQETDASITDKQERSVEEVKLEVLQRSSLETLEEGETIVSLVEIPPDTVLPWHYHPGEEFIYILEGSGTLQRQNKPDTLLTKGTIFKVPFEQAHTAKTGKEYVRALVFRVHKKGDPERIPVEVK